MNFGKLVIASNLNGVRIPVKITNNGYITKINNSKDLAETIINCIKMAKIKTKNEVVKSCTKYFNYEDSISKYLSIFSDK